MRQRGNVGRTKSQLQVKKFALNVERKEPSTTDLSRHATRFWTSDEVLGKKRLVQQDSAGISETRNTKISS